VMTNLAMRQPHPKFSRVGVLDYDAVDDLTATRGWKALETLARGDVDCPTTLGRVSPEMAKRLVVRGYLNTWLTTLLLKQLDPWEQEWLWRLADRIDAMVPVQREPL